MHICIIIFRRAQQQGIIEQGKESFIVILCWRYVGQVQQNSYAEGLRMNRNCNFIRCERGEIMKGVEVENGVINGEKMCQRVIGFSEIR